MNRPDPRRHQLLPLLADNRALAAFESFLPDGPAACGFYSDNKSPKNAKRRASNPTFAFNSNNEDSTIPASDFSR
jgi:hypothetical protein